MTEPSGARAELTEVFRTIAEQEKILGRPLTEYETEMVFGTVSVERDRTLRREGAQAQSAPASRKELRKAVLQIEGALALVAVAIFLVDDAPFSGLYPLLGAALLEIAWRAKQGGAFDDLQDGLRDRAVKLFSRQTAAARSQGAPIEMAPPPSVSPLDVGNSPLGGSE